MTQLHLDRSVLEERVDEVRASPQDVGVVDLIVRRPSIDEREVLDEAELDLGEGLVGDNWRTKGSPSTPDGSSNPLAQVTLMNSRAAALIAGERDRWPLAGDQLYVDFDISATRTPPGTRLELGTAVVEVTDKPHTGCHKFSARFGSDAWRFVNSPIGRQLNLRGINAKVVQAGTVKPGDTIRKL
jgi:MOSC domain-containing protein YiiM